MGKRGDSEEPAFALQPAIRVLGGVLVAAGILFGMSGFAAGSDIVGGVLVGAVGVLVAGTGLATVRAKVWVEGGNLFSRYVRVRRIEGSQIVSITIEVHGSGNNLYPVVRRHVGRKVWLTGMGRFDTQHSRGVLDERVSAIVAAPRV